MTARLLGLTAVTIAAGVGIAAQVVIVPWAYGLELARLRNEPHWDWDTAPSLRPAEQSGRAA